MDALQKIASEMGRSGQSGSGKAPKYELLYDLFIDAIEQGGWKAGERLPAEVELAEKIPVSLGTIQKALRMLADQGVVVRRHGRGSFVANTVASSPKVENFQFLDSDGITVLPVYSRLLSINSSEMACPWQGFFPEGTNYVYISRLFNVNLEFNAFSEALLPQDRFGKLLDMCSRELNVSELSKVLGEHFKSPVLRLSHRLEYAEIPPEICGKISLPRGATGTVWEQIGQSHREMPVFYKRFFVPHNKRKFKIDSF